MLRILILLIARSGSLLLYTPHGQMELFSARAQLVRVTEQL